MSNKIKNKINNFLLRIVTFLLNLIKKREINETKSNFNEYRKAKTVSIISKLNSKGFSGIIICQGISNLKVTNLYDDPLSNLLPFDLYFPEHNVVIIFRDYVNGLPWETTKYLGVTWSDWEKKNRQLDSIVQLRESAVTYFLIDFMGEPDYDSICNILCH